MSRDDTVFEPFGRLEASAAYLSGANMDTDQIIPGRFLKKDRANGYGQFLFFDARFDEQGNIRPKHPLNAKQKPEILLVDDNFGCGSSREGAVYALADYGIRVVISTSFGDIFFNNCFKNGVLAVRLSLDAHQQLRQALSSPRELLVDLPKQSIAWDEQVLSFDIDPFSKTCLLQGVDELALTLSHEADITAFERVYRDRYPWLVPKP